MSIPVFENLVEFLDKEDDLVEHWTCCDDDDIALCGRDMTDRPFVANETTDHDCEFAESIPDRAVIQLKESKYYPGEPGTNPWSIAATWKENG